MESKAYQKKLVNIFNRDNTIGAAVAVKLDDGTVLYTQTDSEAWMLGGHTAVIKLNGVSGCYALSRVTAVSEVAA